MFGVLLFVLVMMMVVLVVVVVVLVGVLIMLNYNSKTISRVCFTDCLCVP